MTNPIIPPRMQYTIVVTEPKIKIQKDLSLFEMEYPLGVLFVITKTKTFTVEPIGELYPYQGTRKRALKPIVKTLTIASSTKFMRF